MRFPGAVLSRLLAAAALSASLVSAGCASARPLAAPFAADESESSDDSGFGREGVYLGLYGLKAYEQFDVSGPSVSTGDSDLGIGAKLGYRASSFFALEVVAEDVKGFSVSGTSADADLDLMSFGVNGKLFLGDGRLQPYLLGGVGAARADIRGFDIDDDGWYARVGLGMDIYLTSTVAFFGEANYNRMMGDMNDLDHVDLQLGILFRF